MNTSVNNTRGSFYAPNADELRQREKSVLKGKRPVRHFKKNASKFDASGQQPAFRTTNGASVTMHRGLAVQALQAEQVLQLIPETVLMKRFTAACEEYLPSSVWNGIKHDVYSGPVKPANVVKEILRGIIALARQTPASSGLTREAIRYGNILAAMC